MVRRRTNFSVDEGMVSVQLTEGSTPGVVGPGGERAARAGVDLFRLLARGEVGESARLSRAPQPDCGLVVAVAGVVPA